MQKNATLESIEKVVRALHISFDILFEKIIPGSIENDIPLQCYELIRKFEEKDQKALFRIITEIVNYKNNSSYQVAFKRYLKEKAQSKFLLTAPFFFFIIEIIT